MFYDAIERSNTILAANFAIDFAAIVTAKGESAIDTSVTIFNRRIASAVAEDITEGGGVAIYTTSAATESKHQGIRNNRINTVWEYWTFGTDPDVVSKTIELAAEALLMSLDRLSGGEGVLGAALPPDSAQVELGNLSKEAGADMYEDYCRLRFQIQERDDIA